MMRSQALLLSFLLAVSIFQVVLSTVPTVQQQCNTDFTKVGVCLGYATGKAPQPTQQCCSTVEDIRDKNPICLCYIIDMTAKGETELKQLGIQEDKLLQLPIACKLVNASLSECPSLVAHHTFHELLNLSPGSPEAAVFKNSSLPAANPSTGPGIPKNIDESIGYVHGPKCVDIKMTVVLEITIFMISVFFV